MNNIIKQAQASVIDIIESSFDSHNTTPFLLVGERGSGKRQIVDYFGTRYGLDIIDIDAKIAPEDIDNYYLNNNPCMYCVDIPKIAKARRIELMYASVLKFIEEPPQNSIIFVLADSNTQTPATISNRCIYIPMRRYRYEELKLLSENLTPEQFRLLNTPGKLEMYSLDKVDEVINFSKFFIDNITTANTANILTAIPMRFEGENAYDLELFLEAVLMNLENRADDNKYFNLFTLTKDFQKDLQVYNVTRAYIFDRYLLSSKYML